MQGEFVGLCHLCYRLHLDDMQQQQQHRPPKWNFVRIDRLPPMSSDDPGHRAKRQRLSSEPSSQEENTVSAPIEAEVQCRQESVGIEDDGEGYGDLEFESSEDGDENEDEDGEDRVPRFRRGHPSELIDSGSPWNTRLCDHCQRWNAWRRDPEHDVFSTKVSVYRDKPIGVFLAECETCIICLAIKDSLHGAIDQDRHDEDFEALRLLNCGPYYPAYVHSSDGFCKPCNAYGCGRGPGGLCWACNAYCCACVTDNEMDCDFFVLLHPDRAASLRQYLLALNRDLGADDKDTVVHCEGSAVVRVKLQYRTRKGDLMEVQHHKIPDFVDNAALRQLLTDCDPVSPKKVSFPRDSD